MCFCDPPCVFVTRCDPLCVSVTRYDPLFVSVTRCVSVTCCDPLFVSVTRCDPPFVSVTRCDSCVTRCDPPCVYHQLLCRLLECACHHSVSVPGVDKLLHAEIAWLQQVKVGRTESDTHRGQTS